MVSLVSHAAFSSLRSFVIGQPRLTSLLAVPVAQVGHGEAHLECPLRAAVVRRRIRRQRHLQPRRAQG